MKHLSLLSILFLTIFASILHTYAQEECGTLSGFDLYKCRIDTQCSFYKPKEIVFQSEEYKSAQEYQSSPNFNVFLQTYGEMFPFEMSKDNYRNNQNGIYSCALIKIQQNTFNLVKQKLLKIDKSGTLATNIANTIDLKLQKIRLTAKNKECKITDKKSIYAKKDILIESSYELCKYSFYQEYLKQYYTEIQNSIQVGEDDTLNKSYSVEYIADKQQSIQYSIDDEIEHSFKIFPIAFEAYLDYENNLATHILLELLRNDFIVFREKLYEALSPINQVVYKISNAMSIH